MGPENRCRRVFFGAVAEPFVALERRQFECRSPIPFGFTDAPASDGKRWEVAKVWAAEISVFVGPPARSQDCSKRFLFSLSKGDDAVNVRVGRASPRCRLVEAEEGGELVLIHPSDVLTCP